MDCITIIFDLFIEVFILFKHAGSATVSVCLGIMSVIFLKIIVDSVKGVKNND